MLLPDESFDGAQYLKRGEHFDEVEEDTVRVKDLKVIVTVWMMEFVRWYHL